MSTDRWIEFDAIKYKLSDGQTALEAMLRGGADLFFSCRRGTCRSCMLEAVSGDPGSAATARLPDDLKKLGFFLPCVADNPKLVVARHPDLSKWVSRAEIAGRAALAPGIFKILLETELQTDWRAGQFISIRNPAGDVRSYSITSLPEDYYIEIHVQHFPQGKVSDWLVSTAKSGDTVAFNGPVGTCYYSSDLPAYPLILVATGSGGGAMMGIARQALRNGHKHPVMLYHGSRFASGLYLREQAAELAAEYGNFGFLCAASGEAGQQRITDIVLSRHEDMSKAALFVCGNPDMVETMRVGALNNGMPLARIFADPFDSPKTYAPKDKAKIKAFPAQPGIWAALGEGRVLTDILTEFYTLAFKDARLAPFFHKVTKQRLIEKQYAFTRDLLTGKKDYFGELPFNAHHWMIISDELFDHRERLFFAVVEKYDLPETVVHKWAGLNEMFRREIVKSSARGQMVDGVEYEKKSKVLEKIEVDTLCDGCQAEIRVGETAMLIERTGELFCRKCSNI